MEVKPKQILIADDEPDILEIIRYNLEKEGYDVHTAKDGNEAIEKAKQLYPDLIILDIMMPRKNGVEVCSILRTQPSFQDTLIIFLTAMSDESSQIKGLETGADDYISKPISPKVLVSRVNALFRRVSTKEAGKTLQIGNIGIDPVKFLVSINGNEVVLAKKESFFFSLDKSKGSLTFIGKVVFILQRKNAFTKITFSELLSFQKLKLNK